MRLCFIVLMCPLVCCAAVKWLELRAAVTEVVDGNVIRVRDRRGFTHVVRLSGSDAPELTQPGGRQARDRLRALLSGKTVRIVQMNATRPGESGE